MPHECKPVALHRHHGLAGRGLDEAPVKATVTDLIVGAFAPGQPNGDDGGPG
ncbi:MAG TPA: hypothetical protein VH307_13440 [Streptosporangiaceae bacterium]|nr:hypothetical protein [Streptosporangiaceae bacterium]